jgi:hypothetical protein
LCLLFETCANFFGGVKILPTHRLAGRSFTLSLKKASTRYHGPAPNPQESAKLQLHDQGQQWLSKEKEVKFGVTIPLQVSR